MQQLPWPLVERLPDLVQIGFMINITDISQLEHVKVCYGMVLTEVNRVRYGSPAEQLAAAPPRRSRRDKPTLEVGRRVRATFEIDGKPAWFFGVVLGVAEAAIIMANKATRMKSAGF